MNRLPIPQEVFLKLQAALEANETGCIELHYKDGNVVSWKKIETGRIKGDAIYLHE